MPKIEKQYNFIPSKSFQKLWLNTRKAKKNYGVLSLPGFYNTSGFAIDAVLFVIAMVLEVIGVYNLMLVGNFEIIMALGLILLDVIAAFMAHANQSNKLLQKNYIKAYNDDPNKILELKNKTKGIRMIVAFIGKVIIIGLALFKIAAFQGLLGTFNGLTLFITASYLLVAYIHIYHTGFFLYELIAAISYKSQVNNLNNRREIPEQYDFEFNNELKEFKHQNRELVLIKEEGGIYTYKLISQGIFDDEDLSLFVNQQENKNRAEFALQCLKFQLDIFDRSN